MRLSDVAADLTRLKSFFIVPHETVDLYPAWERLVTQ
jgi:hypothetical protein